MPIETVTVDEIRHRNDQYETDLYRDGDEVYGLERLYWDGPIHVEASIEFEEYFSILKGEFEVTIEWYEYEVEGYDDPIREDFCIVEVESL